MPSDAFCHHLREAADGRCDDGHLAGHRLERREPEALLRRRQQEQVRDREPGQAVGLLAHEVHAIPQAEIAHALLDAWTLGTVAHEHEVRRPSRRDAGEDVHDRIEPLDGPEVRHVQQERRAGLALQQALTQRVVGLPLVALDVEKVRDDLNLAADAERARRVGGKARRDGRDGV